MLAGRSLARTAVAWTVAAGSPSLAGPPVAQRLRETDP